MQSERRNVYDLPEWQHPDSYGGFSPDGDYLLLTQTRDSDAREESNFWAGERMMREAAAECGEPPERDDMESGTYPWVYVFRAGHWGVGWVEYLMMRHDAPEPLQAAAADMLRALADYPVLDDMDLAEREQEEIQQWWDHAGMRERLELCEAAGVTCFAARHDSPVSEVFDHMRDSV